MGTSTTPISPFLLLTHAPSFCHGAHRRTSPITLISHYTLRKPTIRFSSAIAENTSHLCWVDPPIDDFGGWQLPLAPIPQKKRGFPTFLVVGIGTSFALLLAAFAHFRLSKTEFRFPFTSSSSGSSVEIAVEVTDDKISDSDVPDVANEVAEKSEVDSSDVVAKPPSSEMLHPRVINVIVDSNQLEAMHLLKKLKILDENVEAYELCTRREYARWLVRASSLLGRSPKFKITASAALSGSILSAYEDVTADDPDFESIQALAEAGVVPSKLSPAPEFCGYVNFSPERLLSRQDLIEWRSQLEYYFPTTGNQEILKTKLDLMDMREIRPHELPGIYMDMLAGDRSLLRRVFGQIRRLQPNKPSTIAQAAVALTSGHMAEAIQNELLRIQGEESSQKAAKEEIRWELLDRGAIESYWTEKMEEEKKHGLEVQQSYVDALNVLEQEKIIQQDALNGFVKEKAAMDCQKQLLEVLKQEIDEISVRLVSERNEQISEDEAAQTLRSDLQTKKEGILDAKSLLEAEIEALRILRSWIEDEARKSQARSKVLEEVGRRWKWDR
ncbi:uncharacterized protein LOC130807439 [Amaranthus tricolor]|uniref:uncharacterized protein LOC130807439 n=1 Tax=Amaranthus tricolor TaxID=29722 RepID=UPI00258ECD7F|nr:uncharacterized protein LOC130807439 [Amaranthus tricolor]